MVPEGPCGAATLYQNIAYSVPNAVDVSFTGDVTAFNSLAIPTSTADAYPVTITFDINFDLTDTVLGTGFTAQVMMGTC